LVTYETPKLKKPWNLQPSFENPHIKPKLSKTTTGKNQIGAAQTFVFHPIVKHKAKVIMNLNIQISRHKRGRVFTLLCKNGRDLKLPHGHNLAPICEEGCSWT
jgi:hypothetical protein